MKAWCLGLMIQSRRKLRNWACCTAGRGGEQGGSEPDLRGLSGVDGVGAGQAAGQVLVAAEDEELVLDEGAGAVDREIGEGEIGLGLAKGQQRGARVSIDRPADVIELAVGLVGAGVGDDVEDVAGGAAEFGSEAVGDGLHFAHIDVGNGEEAQAVAVAFGVDHAVHLVVDAVEQAVGVDGAGDAEFRDWGGR